MIKIKNIVPLFKKRDNHLAVTNQTLFLLLPAAFLAENLQIPIL
jgi:hypothetical protein